MSLLVQMGKLFMICGLIVATSACGGLGSKSEENKLEPVETSVNEPRVLPGRVHFSYVANYPDAEFTCRYNVNYPEQPEKNYFADWQDCYAAGKSVEAGPGAKIAFEIYGNSRSGIGSKENTKIEYVVPDTASTRHRNVNPTPSRKNLFTADDQQVARTVIKNKPSTDVTPPYLQLNFDVEGGNSKEYAFECRLARNMEFSPCPLGNSYEFYNLQPKSMVSLEVRAVETETGDPLNAEKVSFRVAQPGFSPTTPQTSLREQVGSFQGRQLQGPADTRSNRPNFRSYGPGEYY